jgi:hypothetical protein
LFEIKKKGRPVTQCEHCRELRKTKQVHVKCICELKEDSPVSAKKGVCPHSLAGIKSECSSIRRPARFPKDAGERRVSQRLARSVGSVAALAGMGLVGLRPWGYAAPPSPLRRTTQ